MMRLSAAVLVWISASLACGTGQVKGPFLEIKETRVDVGTVAQGETIKRIFEFTNKGSEVLEILDVMHG